MEQLTKVTLNIEGMSCAHCEKKIKDHLMLEAGIQDVMISYKTGQAIVQYDTEKIDEARIIRVIEESGYIVSKNLQDRSKGNLKIVGLGVLILALFMVIDNTIKFDFVPEIPASASYGMLFVIGLLTSIHCVAMCGGINLSQCIVVIDFDRKQVPAYRASLYYNLGRVLSYTLIGGIVGWIGSVVSFTGATKGIMAIVVGVLMLIMGVNMLGIFPGLRRLSFQIPSGLRKKVLGDQGDRGPFMIGLLNGLMPCGPLQTMQLYALGTGSPVVGALSMLAFSLGTVPLMFGLGAISTLLSKRFNRNMLKVSGILIILLGVIMLQRGMSLGGLPMLQSIGAGQSERSIGIQAVIEGNIQTVTGDVGSRSYPVITVQKGTLVKFNLHAEPNNINGCNATLVIPEFSIEKNLQPGDNIVEFMPMESGNFSYSCWMGMINSEIKVVDKLP